MKHYKKILFIVLLGLMTGLFFIIQKRASVYPYNVAKSYDYNLQQSAESTVDLSLKNYSVQLPKISKAGQSSFLKINIQTTFMGRWRQPSVEISAGGEVFTQFFERGAKGIRYINVSPFMSEAGSLIHFKTTRVIINNQLAQLFSYAGDEVKKLKILVLAPHPDDAELSAFGLYSGNKNSYVVTITAGEAGGYKYDSTYQNKAQHYLKKGELRTWNSIAVPMLGGLTPEQSINLGFFDSTLQAMFNHKSTPVTGVFTRASDINTFRKQNVSSLSTHLTGGADWNSLVANLSYLLKEIKPDIIVAPYPALENHADHKLTTVAIMEAIKASGQTTGKLYLYFNHYYLSKYYPYGDEGAMVSLPPHFGTPIYFYEIYSHPLMLDKQKDKIFALDAMNDLRLAPTWRFPINALEIALIKLEQKIVRDEDSYYRRAIRSDELFFVVKVSSIYNDKVYKSLVANNAGSPFEEH